MRQGRNLITILLIAWPSLIFGQTVDFSYSTSTGNYCHPQLVTFTQNCTGTPDGFIWRFGNNLSATTPVASTMYMAPGTYTITLIAIYADVAITATKDIVIHPTPGLDLFADRNEMCQPGTVNFTAAGSPFISSYEWDFGDGSPIVSTSGNSTSHLYTAYGEFIVTVTGTTAAGCFASAKDTIRIERFGILDAAVDPSNGCIPINSTLSVIPDPPQGDPVVSYTWNFGDGSPTATTIVPSATHLYNTTMPINTASVTIATASGCIREYVYGEFAFGIPPTDPVAITDDGRDTYCASEIIRFHSTATGANEYRWDFGDGNTLETAVPLVEYRYRSLGPMRVIMTPYFNGCAGLTKDTIYLNIIGVVADYSFRNECGAKNKFFYDNLSLGNVSSFRWNFSDIPGVPDPANYHTSHTFPVNGAFSTQFYLYDDITGCSDSLTTEQFTATPILTINKSKACKGDTLIYNVLNPYHEDSRYIYTFHVSDAVANTIYPTLLIETWMHGSFNEYVVISGPDNNTCDDTVYLSTPTTIGGPVLDFTMPNTACFKNNSFPVTNNSYPFFASEPIVRWDWDFGDFSYSDQKTPPPHSYPYVGAFWMHFKATDINGCVQKDSQLNRVHPTPELFVLPRADTICSGDSLFLYAFTVTDFEWTTNYNINCLTCDTVVVKPQTSTNYVARAWNAFGCENTDTARIKVYEPFNLQISPADTSICIGGRVQFSSNKDGVTSWSPPDFLSDTDIRNPLSIPDTSITYTIIARDSAGCFADTTTAIIQVHDLPTVDAGPDRVVPYYNSFTLNPAYSADGTTWRWSPQINSLSCTTCPFVAGIASQTVNYTVEVANAFGCKARDEVAVIVACSKANLNLPTAFTPNNDGMNDRFYPLTRGYKLIDKLVIFNRWGEKIFERKDFPPNSAMMGWDGKVGNLPVDPGVFVWVVEATCDLGEKVESKGTVMVMR